jgi:hypothetical protein
VNPDRTADSRGREAPIPHDLKGISGSPIRRAFRYGTDPSRWTAADARVVAIETCIVRTSGRLLVRGTRWFVVLALMRHAYPDLAGAIALHDPPHVTPEIRWIRKPD